MDIINQFLTEEVVEKMAVMEDKLRNSDEYRQKCTDVQHIPNGWLDITAEMQKNVVRMFGFETDFEINIALNYLRRAHEIFPNNDICKNRVYVKNNKARQGEIVIGDSYIDVDLYNPMKSNQNRNIKLSNIIDTPKPVLIIASSHT